MWATSHLLESKLIRAENQQASFYETLLVKRMASIWTHEYLNGHFYDISANLFKTNENSQNWHLK